MNLLLSAVLLGSFVVGVDMLLGDGDDLATRFAGMFRSPDRLDWPAGVQEADASRWREPGPAALPGAPGDAGARAAAEIVEDGVAPVPVSPVRPR